MYKIKKPVNKFLLGRDKLMLEMHLRQHKSTYSACGLFTQKKKKDKYLKKPEIEDMLSKQIRGEKMFGTYYKKELQKTNQTEFI